MSAAKTKTPKAPPSHPPYVDMIKEAIVTLKERNGSSQPALKKFIGNKYKLPDGWEKTLGVQLKRLTKDGKLTKVKASFKLGESLKKAPAKPKAAKAKAAPKKAKPATEAAAVKPAKATPKPKTKKPKAEKAKKPAKKVAKKPAAKKATPVKKAAAAKPKATKAKAPKKTATKAKASKK